MRRPGSARDHITMTERRSCLGFIRNNLLTILTIVGVLAGTLSGLALKSGDTQWTKREVMYIQFPGDLFLR